VPRCAAHPHALLPTRARRAHKACFAKRTSASCSTRTSALSRRSLNTLLNTTSDEMRALRDFLVDSKESQQLTLRLLPLRNPRIFDATVFEVV